MKKDIVQVKNPKTGLYCKIDRSIGRIISYKKTNGKYKNIKAARTNSYMTEWISVKDRFPEHQQPVLAYAVTRSGKEGFGVAIFVDSIKMNEELMKTPYFMECVDAKAHPYYFVSQEQKQHTYNVVSHWMPLPKKP
jgi:hypothetical protein